MDALLPRLFACVAASTTGVLWIKGGRPWLRIELVSGWVHAFAAIEPPADAEQLAAVARSRPPIDPLRAFAALLSGPAGLAADRIEVIESDEPRLRLGAATPFHPTRVLRTVAAAELAYLEHAGESAEIDRLLAGLLLSLSAPIHASGLDPDEQRAAALLLERPLSMDDLVARAGSPPTRIRALLRELMVLGALVAGGTTLRADLRSLTARARAVEAERRRSYHAAARQVHPDLRPDADAEARAALTAEMAELAARRRRGE